MYLEKDISTRCPIKKFHLLELLQVVSATTLSWDTWYILVINPNQLSPGQKCPGDNFFFNAFFVSEHFKHFEIYLFFTHFGG